MRNEVTHCKHKRHDTVPFLCMPLYSREKKRYCMYWSRIIVASSGVGMEPVVGANGVAIRQMDKFRCL
ncbi:hypothetical protein Y032_0009g636 [Ancylostoma ceylanicum]|uniref:Uncharacterized protein n=1 Tax=Ancylostoma ceylanicum TaxID=53326 RepID=A0A016VKJ8_9BILA|nr:hypothetical protein Y032_0009g636 [Ancylostoma ceylanicum]